MKIFSAAKVRGLSVAKMRGVAFSAAAGAAGIIALPDAAQAQFFYPRGYTVEPYEDVRPPAYVGRERFYEPEPYARGPYRDAPARRVLVHPGEVIDIAQGEYGLRSVGRPTLRGRVYVIEGLDRSGKKTRLTVSAYEGTILNAERIGPVAVAPSIGEPAQKPRPAAPSGQERKPPREAALPPKVSPSQVLPPAKLVEPKAPSDQPTAARPAPAPEAKPAPANGTVQAPRVVLPNPMAANTMPTVVQPAPLDDAKPKAAPGPSTPTPFVPPALLE